MKKKTHARPPDVGRPIFVLSGIPSRTTSRTTSRKKILKLRKLDPKTTWNRPNFYNMAEFPSFCCVYQMLDESFRNSVQSSVFNRVFSIEWALFKFVDRQHFPKFNDCAGYVYTQKKCSKFASRRVFSGPTLEVRPFEMNWWKKHKNDAIALKRLAMPPIIWHHWMNNLTLDKKASCLSKNIANP